MSVPVEASLLHATLGAKYVGLHVDHSDIKVDPNFFPIHWEKIQEIREYEIM